MKAVKSLLRQANFVVVDGVLFSLIIIIIFIVVDFVLHWNETAMGLHVFPILITPPTSLSIHIVFNNL